VRHCAQPLHHTLSNTHIHTIQQARGDQGKLTGDYIRSMRLLQNTSRGVGDLIMVYKRVSNLAGHTARVAELLEQVGRVQRAGWDCCCCARTPVDEDLRCAALDSSPTVPCARHCRTATHHHNPPSTCVPPPPHPTAGEPAG